MRRNLRLPKKVNETSQHDIKLELDVRCQKLIERRLLAAYPQTALFGEEGVAGVANAAWRWVVDPIDGTVNYSYGIPHACVSIALQRTRDGAPGAARPDTDWETMLGVVYDPFCDELWTATRGRAARLNGRVIRVSDRGRLSEAVISLGFGKGRAVLDHLLPVFTDLTHRVRKLRLMGAAALALTYVASGRFEAFVESGVRLWDIAAGGLILECAGGDFQHEAIAGEHRYTLNAHNGHFRRSLGRYLHRRNS